MDSRRTTFPFSAVVGQDKMKLALLLNVIDPGIGGVLIKGEKGTAKSTTVRSLEPILPPMIGIAGCPFRCEPGHPERMCPDCLDRYLRKEKMETEIIPMRVVELPLSATEDRIAGTLDLEHILQTGKKKFEPGVLAHANGNLLYIDEVNLLEDHIVDMLLDSAAMGVNYVEREGISFSHPSKFILVGSMNPEEGDLRPQLIDRFGLCVDISAERSTTIRSEVVMRRLEFDTDPSGFVKKFEEDTSSIRDNVQTARRLLNKIPIERRIVEMASEVAMNFDMEGHRADITMVKAARANAALNGRSEILKSDISEIAEMVLAHRIKHKPFEKTKFDRGELKECLERL